MMRALRFGVLVAAGLTLSGCGYALVGKGINVDPSIKRIGVPVFTDRTGRAGLDQKVTQKVIEELVKRGRFQVVSDSTGVDAVVEGDLTSYTEIPAGYAPGTAPGERTQASRYAVTLSADVAYTKVGSDAPIWSNERFSVSDRYDVSEGSDGLIDSEQAIDRLTTAFARRLVAEMLEGF
jgi:hypothetical protein